MEGDYDSMEPDVEAESCGDCGADPDHMEWLSGDGVWQCSECGKIQ